MMVMVGRDFISPVRKSDVVERGPRRRGTAIFLVSDAPKVLYIIDYLVEPWYLGLLKETFQDSGTPLIW